MKTLATILAVALYVLLLATILIDPKLIGYGCQGSTLPQLANEESDFPICQEIVRFRS